jgi:hypothetical protein
MNGLNLVASQAIPDILLFHLPASNTGEETVVFHIHVVCQGSTGRREAEPCREMAGIIGCDTNKRRLACQCRCVSGHQGTPSMSLKATILHVNNAFHRTTAKDISPVVLGTHTATRHEYDEKYHLSACITYIPAVFQALKKVFQASPSWSRAMIGFA